MGLGSWRRRLELRRVMVNLKTGSSIQGLVVRYDGPLIFLREAVLFEPGREGVSLDGEAIVDRSEIEFIQAPFRRVGGEG